MRLPLLALVCLVVFTDTGASAGRVAQAQDGTGTLRGRVVVRRAPTPVERRPTVSDLGTPAAREPSDTGVAVVYLQSAPRGAFDAQPPSRARMDQRGETFVPHVLAVSVGTVVDFPNNDSTYHNVFSLSKTQRFDLGRYARGRSKSVRFERPGIVRVFCDIHSHMSAFVLVFAHPYFAVTDGQGRYSIDGIPPGTYAVAAWHEGQPRVTQTVTIPLHGGTVEQDFQLP
jgi:plastocyanin